MRRLLIGLGLAVLIITFGTRHVTEPPSSTASTQVESPVLGPTYVGGTVQHHKPVRPRWLHLNTMRAPVVKLRLNGAELVPPNDPQVLGWWGRRAGARHGTTLLVGHTVHTGGGTFDNLEDTRAGDLVVVSGVRYRVERVNTPLKGYVAKHARRLFNQHTSHKLVLVTCEDYSPATGHYSSNVVVVARPEGVR